MLENLEAWRVKMGDIYVLEDLDVMFDDGEIDAFAQGFMVGYLEEG